jgi:hypothetical protein
MVNTDTVIPKWLRRELSSSPECSDLLIHGLVVLTAASQLAANGQLVKPSASDPRTPEWLDGLQSRLCNLPNRTRSFAADMGPSAKHLAATMAAIFLASSQRESSQSSGPLTRTDTIHLLGGLANALPKLHVAGGGANLGLAAVAASACPQRTPHTLIRAAYEVLRSNRDQSSLVQSDVDALILIGIAASALMHLSGCEFCFRLAVPGHRACSEHSLSSEADGDRLERQARYQSGRRAVVAYRSQLRQLPIHFNAIASINQRNQLVATILWGDVVPDEKRVAASLLMRIEKYPRVKRIVERSGAVRPGQLFDRLRQELDPHEFIVGNWRAKLRAAEVWFQAVEISTPGKRGSGVQSSDRNQLALRLVKGMALSKSELASALNMSASALSKWLLRNKDDPVIAEIESRLAQAAERVADRKSRHRELSLRIAKPRRV